MLWTEHKAQLCALGVKNLTVRRGTVTRAKTQRMCHEQGGLKQLLCLKHTNTELWFHPSIGNCQRGLHGLLMEKPPALVSNPALSWVKISWQLGAAGGTTAGAGCQCRAQAQGNHSCPTSLDFLQHRSSEQGAPHRAPSPDDDA